MKIGQSLLLAASILSGILLRAQTSGGPDQFGYHWANNLDPIGSAPVYTWIDIKDTANEITGLADDNSVGPIDMKWYFNYYGKWYNMLWIHSNGWISFQNTGEILAPFPMIPAPDAPDNIIAPMLSDLTFKAPTGANVPGASAYYWSNNIDSVIVQYDSVPFWVSNAPFSGRSTFQVILAGTDNSILFQYKSVVDGTPSYDLVGEGLRVGIEDSTGDDGLQVTNTFPANMSAVKFYYPGHFSTNDIENTISVQENFPNPATGNTILGYTLKKSGEVTITVQNMVGETMDTFFTGKQQPGNHSFLLNTANYPSGIYFYSLFTEGASASRKMLVVR